MKQFLLTLFAATALHASATDYTSLTLTTTDGAQTLFALNGLTLTVSDSRLVAATASATQTFALSDVATLSLGDGGLTAGDFDGSGTLTTADAEQLVAFLLGTNTAIDATAADLNGDGSTSVADVVLLNEWINSGASAATSYATMNVVAGNLTVDYNASDVGTMTVGDGTTLTIAGKTYTLTDLSSITFDNTVQTAATVNVTYSGTTATAAVAGDVAALLTATLSAADVAFVQDSSLTDEITYTLSGTSSDGSFYMDGELKATVALNGLTLTNADGAAIQIDNGKRIAIVVTDGTTNTLTDGAGTQDACFFVNGHAEFSGGGTLNITGNAKHAYRSDEYTEIKSSFGTLNITGAARDGIHCRQYFRMKGGTVNVAGTTGDGIDVEITDDTTDELNGQALLEGGTLNLSVTSVDTKGVACDSLLTVSGTTVVATVSGNGCKGFKSGTNMLMSGGSLTMTVSGTTYTDPTTGDESKCRGVSVTGDLTLSGGTLSFTVTGNKAKAIKVDGNLYYTSAMTSYTSYVDADGTATKI